MGPGLWRTPDARATADCSTDSLCCQPTFRGEPDGTGLDTAMSRPLEVSVAVHEERLDQIEEEQLRHRQRIHDLESDRATLRLLSRQVSDLVTAVERTAKQAALEAIDMAMQSRDELGRRRWGLRLQWLATGAAVGGFVVAIVLAFSK